MHAIEIFTCPFFAYVEEGNKLVGYSYSFTIGATKYEAIHSVMSDDRSNASSKTVPPHSAI